MNHIAELLRASRGALASPQPIPQPLLDSCGAGNSVLLAAMLENKNGFFAFESALHVFPVSSPAGKYDLVGWNSPSLWKDAYGDLLDSYVFFAEDLFGTQFGIRDDTVFSVDPETGEPTVFSANLNGWAEKILRDADYHTGYPIARQWRIQNGPIEVGHRLMPKVPFVCGGEFAIDNLYALDAVEGMRFRGELAQQIRDLPDGAQIVFRVE